jgi:hypothetical protein
VIVAIESNLDILPTPVLGDLWIVDKVRILKVPIAAR